MPDSQLKMMDCLIDYAGKAKRSGDLFHNKDFKAKAQSFFKSVFTEVNNVFTQHKPQLTGIVEELLSGKLS